LPEAADAEKTIKNWGYNSVLQKMREHACIVFWLSSIAIFTAGGGPKTGSGPRGGAGASFSLYMGTGMRWLMTRDSPLNLREAEADCKKPSASVAAAVAGFGNSNFLSGPQKKTTSRS